MTSKINILAIDDNESILRLLKARFDAIGYNLIATTDSENGIALIHKENFLCVLLDMNLGAESGDTVLKKIKEISPDLPVILVTGEHEEALARKIIELGAHDYVTKPIDFDYLNKTISYLAN